MKTLNDRSFSPLLNKRAMGKGIVLECSNKSNDISHNVVPKFYINNDLQNSHNKPSKSGDVLL